MKNRKKKTCYVFCETYEVFKREIHMQLIDKIHAACKLSYLTGTYEIFLEYFRNMLIPFYFDMNT